MRPRDGTSRDNVTVVWAVETRHEPWRTPESDPRVFVAESGIDREATRRRFPEAMIRWIRRGPETSTEAKAVVETAAERAQWQHGEDRQIPWFTSTISLPQGQEQWAVYADGAGRSTGPDHTPANGGEG